MKSLIILTGSEARHDYFRIKISLDKRFKVIKTFCEGLENSLKKRIKDNPNADFLEIKHVQAREQAELDFFKDYIELATDKSNPSFIKKGDINKKEIVNEIKKIDPDLIVCYGSSLIEEDLINHFKGRFLNIHLGISPFYRGSGTNIWPMINKELDFIGATFMHIDEGIDTGSVIKQIRAKIFLGDGPHSIGTRLIKDMTEECAEIICSFETIKSTTFSNKDGKLYKRNDFNQQACKDLYEAFKTDMIEDYLIKNNKK